MGNCLVCRLQSLLGPAMAVGIQKREIIIVDAALQLTMTL
jgi:hypothetical protein